MKNDNDTEMREKFDPASGQTGVSGAASQMMVEVMPAATMESLAARYKTLVGAMSLSTLIVVDPATGDRLTVQSRQTERKTTTATLPFRILGLAGVVGGPNDPASVNQWIEVRLNTSDVRQVEREVGFGDPELAEASPAAMTVQATEAKPLPSTALRAPSGDPRRVGWRP